jgi:hypothetical protein
LADGDGAAVGRDARAAPAVDGGADQFEAEAKAEAHAHAAEMAMPAKAAADATVTSPMTILRNI